MVTAKESLEKAEKIINASGFEWGYIAFSNKSLDLFKSKLAYNLYLSDYDILRVLKEYVKIHEL